jgi:hypothetical protein
VTGDVSKILALQGPFDTNTAVNYPSEYAGAACSVSQPMDCINISYVRYKDCKILEVGQDDPGILRMIGILRNPAYPTLEYSYPTKYAVVNNSIIFNSLLPELQNASSATINPALGLLTVTGFAYLPQFEESDASQGSGSNTFVNPLVFLPAKYQLLPAYYVLANIPLDSNDKLALTRMQLYQQKWQTGLSELQFSAATRGGKEFSYDG